VCLCDRLAYIIQGQPLRDLLAELSIKLSPAEALQLCLVHTPLHGATVRARKPSQGGGCPGIINYSVPLGTSCGVTSAQFCKGCFFFISNAAANVNGTEPSTLHNAVLHCH